MCHFLNLKPLDCVLHSCGLQLLVSKPDVRDHLSSGLCNFPQKPFPSSECFAAGGPELTCNPGQRSYGKSMEARVDHPCVPACTEWKPVCQTASFQTACDAHLKHKGTATSAHNMCLHGVHGGELCVRTCVSCQTVAPYIFKSCT